MHAIFRSAMLILWSEASQSRISRASRASLPRIFSRFWRNTATKITACSAELLGQALVDEENQRIRDELFKPERRDDLIQALLAPFPEIATSTAAIAAERSRGRSRIRGGCGGERLSLTNIDLVEWQTLGPSEAAFLEG